VGFGSHGLDLAIGVVERHDGRLVEDDAAAAGEDAGVGSAQVDRDVCCEGGEEIHEASLIEARGIKRSLEIGARKTGRSLKTSANQRWALPARQFPDDETETILRK
jgi:hypothetical protein